MKSFDREIYLIFCITKIRSIIQSTKDNKKIIRKIENFEIAERKGFIDRCFIEINSWLLKKWYYYFSKLHFFLSL